MSSIDLIQPLLQGSGLLGQCSTKSTQEKNARQLLGTSLKFLDLAKQIRLGQLTIGETDMPRCLKEVSDAIQAATNASKEADYAAVIVEAHEAIDFIAMHSGAGALFSEGSRIRTETYGIGPGLQTVPDPSSLPWPPVWPVWPHLSPLPPLWPPGWPHGPWGPLGPDPRAVDKRAWAATAGGPGL